METQLKMAQAGFQGLRLGFSCLLLGVGDPNVSVALLDELCF